MWDFLADSIETAQDDGAVLGINGWTIDCAAEERLLREADRSTMDEKGQKLLHLAVSLRKW